MIIVDFFKSFDKAKLEFKFWFYDDDVPCEAA